MQISSCTSPSQCALSQFHRLLELSKRFWIFSQGRVTPQDCPVFYSKTGQNLTLSRQAGQSSRVVLLFSKKRDNKLTFQSPYPIIWISRKRRPQVTIGVFRKCPEGYETFIPHPFPPPKLVTWNNHLASEISRADLALGNLAAVDQLVPDIDFFISMYASQEATLSSQIEGTQATLGGTTFKQVFGHLNKIKILMPKKYPTIF